jgi:hypothetical protein
VSGEIEPRVYEGEIVAEPDDFPYELDSYEDHENALINERQSEDVHRWNQCRIAASAVGRFKRGLVGQLARAAGLSPQTIYDYARAYESRRRLRGMGSPGEARGTPEDSGQPETLAPTHHVELSYAPEEHRQELALRADEEGWSSQRTRQEVREIKQKKAEAEHGRTQTVEAKECPSCGADSKFWQRIPAEVNRER